MNRSYPSWQGLAGLLALAFYVDQGRQPSLRQSAASDWRFPVPCAAGTSSGKKACTSRKSSIAANGVFLPATALAPLPVPVPCSPLRVHVVMAVPEVRLAEVLQDWETTQFLFQEEYHVPLPVTGRLLPSSGRPGKSALPLLLMVGLLSRYAALGLSAVNVMAVVSYSHVLLGEGYEAALGQHYLWGSPSRRAGVRPGEVVARRRAGPGRRHQGRRPWAVAADIADSLRATAYCLLRPVSTILRASSMNFSAPFPSFGRTATAGSLSPVDKQAVRGVARPSG